MYPPLFFSNRCMPKIPCHLVGTAESNAVHGILHMRRCVSCTIIGVSRGIAAYVSPRMPRMSLQSALYCRGMFSTYSPARDIVDAQAINTDNDSDCDHFKELILCWDWVLLNCQNFADNRASKLSENNVSGAIFCQCDLKWFQHCAQILPELQK